MAIWFLGQCFLDSYTPSANWQFCRRDRGVSSVSCADTELFVTSPEKKPPGAIIRTLCEKSGRGTIQGGGPTNEGRFWNPGQDPPMGSLWQVLCRICQTFFDLCFASVVRLFKPRGISCVVADMVWWKPKQTSSNHWVAFYSIFFGQILRPGASIQGGGHYSSWELLFRGGAMMISYSTQQNEGLEKNATLSVALTLEPFSIVLNCFTRLLNCIAKSRLFRTGPLNWFAGSLAWCASRVTRYFSPIHPLYLFTLPRSMHHGCHLPMEICVVCRVILRDS